MHELLPRFLCNFEIDCRQILARNENFQKFPNYFDQVTFFSEVTLFCKVTHCQIDAFSAKWRIFVHNLIYNQNLRSQVKSRMERTRNILENVPKKSPWKSEDN